MRDGLRGPTSKHFLTVIECSMKIGCCLFLCAATCDAVTQHEVNGTRSQLHLQQFPSVTDFCNLDQKLHSKSTTRTEALCLEHEPKVL